MEIFETKWNRYANEIIFLYFIYLLFTNKKIIYIIFKTKEKGEYKLEYQKFIPEGWEENNPNISKEVLNNALQTGCIMQGLVNSCDTTYILILEIIYKE